MPVHCSVPRCIGTGGHRFPSDQGLRKRWIIAVKRGENHWNPSKWSTVCKAHFDEFDYVKSTKEGDNVVNSILKQGILPHIFQWKSPSQFPYSWSRKARALKKQMLVETNNLESIGAYRHVGCNIEISSTAQNEVCDGANAVWLSDDYQDGSTQTLISGTCPTDAVTQTNCCRTAATDYMFDDNRFHFHTGLNNYQHFRFIFQTFGEVVSNLNYYYGTTPNISPEDQFYLCIIKLRLARANSELANMFLVSEKEVANIFITWINFLYFQMKDINWWPSRDLVRFYAPSDFRVKFPTTRVIVDGTECPVSKPKQPVAQQATYSTYKNRNTVKALVGITPGGLVSYVSDVYGGSASDRQICERSTLSKICDSGDSIMSDKGFNVQDLFIESNVVINIPEFFKKKNRMSGSSVMKDRKIASKRVHVERIIGLAKTFTILKKPLNNTESGLADAIISVCFFLCNFKPSIIHKNA